MSKILVTMDPLSLLVTSYELYSSVRDNLATVQSNKCQFKLLGERIEELDAPIRRLQDLQRASNTVPCSEQALKNLNRTLGKIDAFIKQKRFRRMDAKLNPLHFISDMYYAADDQQTFIEYNSLLCNNLQGLRLGITVILLDFAAAASKDQIVTNQSAALVDVQAKAVELRGLEYNPNDTSNKLGQGGFSTVRSGKYNGQAVAIKHVQQLEHFSPKDLKMINKEALVMQFADHPNIVKLKGVSLQQGLLVMELAACSLNDILHPVDGVFSPRAQTVKTSMGSGAAAKLAWKMQVIRDISDAVSYLHAHHILHRDIKSANVMLFLDAASGRTVAKIGDFGLALAVDLVSRTAGMTAAKTSPNLKAAGTYNYMAPELFDRQPGESVAYSDASDVFSVGILINEIMTEQVPWGGTARERDVEKWVLDQQLRPNKWDRSITSSLPLGDALYDLVGDNERPHGCFHQQPAQRPRAEEILQVTSRCVGSSAPPSPVPSAGSAKASVPPPKPPKPAARTTSAVATASAVLPCPSSPTPPVSRKITFPNGDAYEGQWNANKMEGFGIYYYHAGDVYEGHMVDGKKEGHGVYKFANGEVYDGQWKADRGEGHGIFKYADGEIYDGQWKDQLKDGLGTHKFADGRVYEGQWKDGSLEGHGVMRYPNGAVYDGNWRDDNREGHGFYTYACGDTYEGDWQADQQCGQAVFRFVSGDVHEGQWKNGKFEGYGVYTFPDGRVYKGLYKDNVREGRGVYTANGDVFEGYWENDVFVHGTCAYANGSAYDGQWENGLYARSGEYKFADGKTFYRGEWKGGKMHGDGIMKYATGELYDGQWKENKRHGHAEFKYADGRRRIGRWEDDNMC